MPSRIGIIAGRGDFPLKVANYLKSSGEEIFVLPIKNSAKKELSDFPHKWIRLGQIGLGIKTLRRNHCKDIVIIGGVDVPNLWFLWPDFGSLKLYLRLIALKIKGDAAIIKEVINFLEKDYDFKVIGAENFLQEAVMPKGFLSGVNLNEYHIKDIRLAKINCKEIGLKDMGQACVVSEGSLIMSEDLKGTDAMLQKIIKNKKKFKKKGVLVKLMKPQQDIRVDMPTIGLKTLLQVKEIGLAGIALEAGKALVSDKEDVIEFAKKNNIFIYGFEKDEFI